MEGMRNENQNYVKLHRKETTPVKSEKESDTEVIIASLKKLQIKLRELEDEREDASKLIEQLRRSGEHLLNKNFQPKSPSKLKNKCISTDELDRIKNYCDEVENNLTRIMIASKKPLIEPNLKKDFVPVAKNQILKKETIYSERAIERKHFKPDIRYPFVPPGSGRTYSLPGTIQTLVSNMQSQHSHLCFLTEASDSVMDVISSSESYLKQMASTMIDSAQYLKTECLRYSKQMNDDLTGNSPLALSLAHLDVIAKLIERILDLQSKIVILKKRIKAASKLESQIQTVATKDDQKFTDRRFPNKKLSKKVNKTINPRHKHSNTTTRKPNVHPFHQRPSHQLKKPVTKTRDLSNAKVVHSNTDTLRYVKILQTSLRKNGYRLKMIED